MSETAPHYLELAHTLPSLQIFYMKVPMPMAESDFGEMVRTIETWKQGIRLLSEKESDINHE